MKIYWKYVETTYLFLLLLFAVKTFARSKYNKNGASLANDTSSSVGSNNIRGGGELENNTNLNTLRALLDLDTSSENKYLGKIWLKPLVLFQDNNGISLSQSSSVGISDSISREMSSNEVSNDESRNNYKSSEESNDDTILGAINHDLSLNLKGSGELSLHIEGISVNRKPTDISNNGGYNGSESDEQNYNNNGASEGSSKNSSENINENANGITVAPENNEQSTVSSSNNNRHNNENVSITITHGNNEQSSNEGYNNENKNNTTETSGIVISQEENNNDERKNNTVSLNNGISNNNSTNSTEGSYNVSPFVNCGAVINYLYKIQDNLICEFLQRNNNFFYNLCCNTTNNS